MESKELDKDLEILKEIKPSIDTDKIKSILKPVLLEGSDLLALFSTAVYALEDAKETILTALR